MHPIKKTAERRKNRASEEWQRQCAERDAAREQYDLGMMESRSAAVSGKKGCYRRSRELAIQAYDKFMNRKERTNDQT